MDYYHVPIPTPEFEIDGKKPHHTTPHHTMALQYCVSADNTERNLADLDYIPTEQLFCESKYKKMVKNKKKYPPHSQHWLIFLKLSVG